MECRESSQSSGISLADISINTNLSDSELDDEDTVLGSNKFCVVKKQLQNGGIFDIKSSGNGTVENVFNFSSNLPSRVVDNPRPCRTVPEGDVMPLGDVRHALQENSSFLNDQNLIYDLLQSLDVQIKKSSSDSNTYGSNTNTLDLSVSRDPPNKDPGPGFTFGALSGFTSQSSKPINEDYMHNAVGGSSLKDRPQDFSSKQVAFNKLGLGSSPLDTEPIPKSPLEVSQMQGLLQQLSSLRWRLGGWELAGLDPPTDERSASVFVHKLLMTLGAQREQNKYLEEQFVNSEKKLKRACEELTVFKKLQDKEKGRLQEADTQIGILQRDWIKTYESSCSEIRRVLHESHQMKKEQETIKKENIELENKLQHFRELTKDHQTLKISLEEVQSQLSDSKRQTADMAEENARIYDSLQDKEQHIRELEEIELINMKRELDEKTSSLEALETSNKELVRSKAHLADDFHILHKQYQALLKKIVHEKEEKESALKEKETLEAQVYDLTVKLSAMKNELHDHYQTQVQELVNHKTETLQTQIQNHEATLKRNLEEQLNALRNSHHHALTKIQEGHNKEIQDLCSAQSLKVSELQNQLHQLHNENLALRTQQQSIFKAVSSILAPESQVHNPKAMSSQKIQEIYPWNNNIASTSTPINTRPISPVCDNATKGMPSKTGSYHTSAKSEQNCIPFRVPELGRFTSSSSDSGNSAFMDGKETVRQNGGGSLLNTCSSKDLYCSSKSEGVILPSTQLNENGIAYSIEREFRSLPDLQNRKDFNHIDCRQDMYDRVPSETENALINSTRRMALPAYQNLLEKEASTNFARKEKQAEKLYLGLRKIYRASEILQNDEETVDDFSNLIQVDKEMAKLKQDLMLIKSSNRTTDSEAPTHDTSFDQEPANITLRKLNQVSTLLSQFVKQPASS
ncbi:hypothetical protein SK128_006953 [Halocaridina rubra]|uniref:Uncharacterized protein n=1 Tax=Halocaridina rubra TaxID=373956 RepID=A0AAN8X8F6_HALRR